MNFFTFFQVQNLSNLLDLQSNNVINLTTKATPITKMMFFVKIDLLFLSKTGRIT